MLEKGIADNEDCFALCAGVALRSSRLEVQRTGGGPLVCWLGASAAAAAKALPELLWCRAGYFWRDVPLERRGEERSRPARHGQPCCVVSGQLSSRPRRHEPTIDSLQLADSRSPPPPISLSLSLLRSKDARSLLMLRCTLSSSLIPRLPILCSFAAKLWFLINEYFRTHTRPVRVRLNRNGANYKAFMG